MCLWVQVRVVGAQHVFDEMSVKEAVAWTIILSGESEQWKQLSDFHSNKTTMIQNGCSLGAFVIRISHYVKHGSQLFCHHLSCPRLFLLDCIFMKLNDVVDLDCNYIVD